MWSAFSSRGMFPIVLYDKHLEAARYCRVHDRENSQMVQGQVCTGVREHAQTKFGNHTPSSAAVCGVALPYSVKRFHADVVTLSFEVLVQVSL